jgi:hypothetical protein
MAINNFTRVHIDTKGTLIVSGETHKPPSPTGALGPSTNLGAGAHIRVVVIAVNDLDKRCEPEVDDPTTSPWSATCATHPFIDGEEVWTVGSAIATGQVGPFLWGDGFTVGDPAK